MIIVKRNMSDYAYRYPAQYGWVAYYGDRIVFAANVDRALQLAWATWGGDVPALVHT